MRVFNTYFYEVQKGTKPAALVTCDINLSKKILTKLKKSNISYAFKEVCADKINIFFGAKECIDLIEKYLLKPLENLNSYEDFILGAILGYDVKMQCKRFLKKELEKENKSFKKV